MIIVGKLSELEKDEIFRRIRGLAITHINAGISQVVAYYATIAVSPASDRVNRYGKYGLSMTAL
jgi:hypothetical protein